MIYVEAVRPYSLFASVGIERGDQIVQVNDIPFTNIALSQVHYTYVPMKCGLSVILCSYMYVITTCAVLTKSPLFLVKTVLMCWAHITTGERLSIIYCHMIIRALTTTQ